MVSRRARVHWAGAGLVALVAACGDEKKLHADAGVVAPDAAAGAGRDSGVVETIYTRLGGEAGVTAAVGGFIGRVATDPKINGYFLNTSVNGTRLTTCLVKIIGAATGGPQTYPSGSAGPDADGCRTIKAAHVGLGISRSDFNDLAAHLVAELEARSLPATDIAAIVDALSPLAGDIVESPDGDETLYHRLGRKPGIEAVMAGFLGRVVADPKINGYFLNADLNVPRLKTCLVRQVCGATGGPCKYGEELGPELFNTPCRPMRASHMSLGISRADFDDLVGHLVAQLSTAAVAQADIASLTGVLGGLVPEIVESPNNDENIYQRVGRKPGVIALVNDFAARVLADPTLNGFFGNTDAQRLGTCLMRQVCGATGGPCKYGRETGPELLNATPCRDMTRTHRDLRNPAGNPGGAPITRADFDALVAHLVGAMTAGGVGMMDRDAIVSVLAPLCPMIVANGTGC